MEKKPDLVIVDDLVSEGEAKKIDYNDLEERFNQTFLSVTGQNKSLKDILLASGLAHMLATNSGQPSTLKTLREYPALISLMEPVPEVEFKALGSRDERRGRKAQWKQERNRHKKDWK